MSPLDYCIEYCIVIQLPSSPPYKWQISVLFVGDSRRRVLVNTTACVLSYSYNGVSQLGDVRGIILAKKLSYMPDPGDFLLSLMLHDARSVHMQITQIHQTRQKLQNRHGIASTVVAPLLSGS